MKQQHILITEKNGSRHLSASNSWLIINGIKNTIINMKVDAVGQKLGKELE